MPKTIPVTEMRQWLKYYEQGRSEASIAKDAKRDVKTVKRGIEHARRERDAAAARTELLKEALHKHQNQLLGIIDNVLAALVMLGPDLALSRERDGSLVPIRLPGAIVSYDKYVGLVLELSDEDTAQWGLLREHLRHDRLWGKIDRWKEKMIAHLKARLALKHKAEFLLYMRTGYKLVETPITPPFLYSNSANLFYKAALNRALGVPNDTNMEEQIIADADSGEVRYGIGLILAEAPGAVEKCKASILNAYIELLEAGEVQLVAGTYEDLEQSTAGARRSVEEISLLGLVPGQCRVCRRLGM